MISLLRLNKWNQVDPDFMDYSIINYTLTTLALFYAYIGYLKKEDLHAHKAMNGCVFYFIFLFMFLLC